LFRANENRRNWQTIESQRAFLDALAPKLGFAPSDFSRWYAVSNRELLQNGAGGLLDKHQFSRQKMLQAIYPEFAWEPLHFPRAPRHHWESIENQRAFFMEIAQDLGFQANDISSWYKIPKREILRRGGGAILEKHNSSLSLALQKVFPELAWDASKFSRAPRNHWSSLINQRNFIENVSRKLGFKEGDLGRWYDVPQKTLLDNGGTRLLALYKGSLPLLLSKVFPEFDWKLWKFPGRTLQVQRDPQAFEEMIVSAEKELGIKEPREWLRVTQEQIEKVGISKYFSSRTEMIEMLQQRKYPNVPFNTS